jgi:hypothetical protein
LDKSFKPKLNRPLGRVLQQSLGGPSAAPRQ